MGEEGANNASTSPNTIGEITQAKEKPERRLSKPAARLFTVGVGGDNLHELDIAKQLNRLR